MTKITHAELAWDEAGQPISNEFNDIYFSKSSGLAETRCVFIEHNKLHERFKALTANQQFVIVETGFGTGLNFLCAWQLFDEVAPKNARLHFISVEKYPLTKQDLQRALSLWHELLPFSQELLSQYIAIHKGYQNFVFANGRILLTLLVGDVHEQLPNLNVKVDAWFLDGFAPAKNPQMWTEDLFKQVARLSNTNTTIATFTSAGFVRRGLTEVGFTIEKDKGFANKREMLYGKFERAKENKPNRRNTTPPWYSRLTKQFTKRTAIVVGAGVAGAASAASLAARGWQVTVLERNADIALEGSGNAQGILYLKLSAHQTLQSRLLIEGFGYTRRLLEVLTTQGKLVKGEDWQDCGVLQLAFDEKEQKRQRQLTEAFASSLLYPVSQQQASELAGLSVNNNGLFFPEGCWVKPRQLCKALLDHPKINIVCNQPVDSLEYRENKWHALDKEKLITTAEIVVLAGATDSKQFAMTQQLPIKAIRGQTTELPATVASQALSAIVCSDGYISPARDSKHCLGATFNFHAADLKLSNIEHQQNIATLKTISVDLADRLQVDQLDLNKLSGRAAYRCTATDYLPVVGPLADREAFLNDYQVLIKDAKKIPNTLCPWINALFLNTAHGSRGLITAPLCGEILATWLENEPFPIEQDLMEACHPNRFYIRELRYFRRHEMEE